MRKIILKLLKKYYEQILEEWILEVRKEFSKRLTPSEIKEFVEFTLVALTDVVRYSDYLSTDQYLVDSYTLFTKSKIDLLEVGKIFSTGRRVISENFKQESDIEYDPTVGFNFLDGILEQLFARYSMLYQNTQIKEVSVERDRLAKKLDSSQKYLNVILHKSDSAIAVIDCNEKFVSWSYGAKKMFGYSEEEVIGQPSTFLLPEGDKYLEELDFIISETQKRGDIKIVETQRKKKSGEIIHVELKVTQLESNEKDNCSRTMIMTDLTEIKKLQNQVDQSEKLAVIGQLAAGVAHEIGNPLTSISALVQLIQRKNKDAKMAEQLETIKDNIDRISRTVHELVDFSRPSGENKELLIINDVVKTAVGIVKYDKRVKSVEFITDYCNKLPPVMAVSDQLLQVFVNILINALDAINGEGKIEVSTYLEDIFIVVKIKDNGCGISKDVIGEIFTPFFTTKVVGKGTGLGLSVSYGIIKKMRGEILVESEMEKGTTFFIKLLS